MSLRTHHRPKDLLSALSTMLDPEPESPPDSGVTRPPARSAQWDAEFAARLRAWYCASAGRDIEELREKILQRLDGVDSETCRIVSAWVSDIIREDLESFYEAVENNLREANEARPAETALVHDPRD